MGETENAPCPCKLSEPRKIDIQLFAAVMSSNVSRQNARIAGGRAGVDACYPGAKQEVHALRALQKCLRVPVSFLLAFCLTLAGPRLQRIEAFRTESAKNEP